jgi:tetratricopeptide (TPR) repeat protein
MTVASGTGTAPDSSRRWLYGPVSDLLFGCGVLYGVVVAIYAIAGSQLRTFHPTYLLPLLVLLVTMPHYGATLLRVYEHRADRQGYVIFSVYATIAVCAAYAYGVYDTYFASILFTIYLTWSPWHYTGQNYGLAVMFLRRRGVALAPRAKRWLYASFVSSFVITFLVLHGSNEAPGYVPNPVGPDGGLIALVPIGIPTPITQFLLGIATLGYVVSLAAALRLVSREASWRDLGPTVALCATQALWFSLPFSVQFWKLQTGLAPLDLQVHHYVMWIAMGHAAQYLWVTTFYARSSNDWTGYGSYLGKAFAAGAALWTLPAILLAPGALGNIEWAAGLALLVAAGVNLHHFILDGAIWKLRNSRVGGVLIRSVPDDEVAVMPRSWRRRVVWGLCASTAIAAPLVIWLNYIGYGMALDAGDTRATRHVMDTLAFFGQDSHASRATLAKNLSENGDFAEAATQYRNSVALRNNRYAWSGLAKLSVRERDWPAVVAAYDATADLGPRPPELLHYAVNAFYALDRPIEARRVVEETVAGMPKTPSTHVMIAHWQRQLGDLTASVEHYQEAIALAPEDPDLANELAWILATAADESVRDPDAAIRLLRHAVAGEGQPNPSHLDSLAAAYAAAGRFEDAVTMASRAVAVAEAAGDAQVVREVSNRLTLYRASKPYISDPGERRR